MTTNRTKKEFSDYNDYHDRGFLKWVTAFAMEELTSGIDKNHAEATKNVSLLPQMSQQEISDVLKHAFLKTKAVSVQLNKKDSLGRPMESIDGFFSGNFHEEELLIDDNAILWEDIRHVQLIETIKWSSLDIFKGDGTKDDSELIFPQNWLEE